MHELSIAATRDTQALCCQCVCVVHMTFRDIVRLWLWTRLTHTQALLGPLQKLSLLYDYAYCSYCHVAWCVNYLPDTL